MEKYLDRNIKDIIAEFPAAGTALQARGIACVSCGAGTCRLRDIVDMHDLAPEEETSLMRALALAIDPSGALRIPEPAPRARPAGGPRYSPPLRRLVDEHALIKRVLGALPSFLAGADLASPADAARAREVIRFIRSYADRLHHAKEEEILFGLFDPSLDVLKAMLAEHETGRAHVRAAAAALDAGDGPAAAVALSAYRELLLDHIKKEDEVLYPWMDRNLSMTQVGKLSESFNEADAKAPDGEIAACERIAEEFPAGYARAS
ncbi:MAG: hemerythrin domain-containing protein [Elusimicrobia bacterium]|nr:hemerythrin domain-containing protein [Elusimicrobiota bacterium]